MSQKFYLKKGDTYPNIETILSDRNGPINLEDCEVTFRMSESGSGNLMIEKPATVVMPQEEGNVGRCYAEFEAGETDIVGTYRVEWRVVFPNTKVATFPRSEAATDFNYVIIQQTVN